MAANAGKILLPGSIRRGFIQSSKNKAKIYPLINSYRLLIVNRCGKLHAAFRGVFESYLRPRKLPTTKSSF
jgi:hypothetical protein